MPGFYGSVVPRVNNNSKDFSTANTVVLNNSTSTAFVNYPLQIGRAFRQGEIPSGQSPSFIDGRNFVPTQATVKNRWGDGSVKFAVLSTVIPNIPGNTRQTWKIVPSSPLLGGNSDPTRLLDASKNFDVKLTFDNGLTDVVSVRDMISAGAYSVWQTGPISTTWIFADHTTRAFDVGPDVYKSLRPIIHVTYWDSLDVYKVRVILEICDTSKLQNYTYSVIMSTGVTNSVTRYTSPTITHRWGRRWTREFWAGTNAPTAELGVGHNVGYMASTRCIPNYDSSVRLSAGVVSSFNSSWAVAAKQPTQNGFWQVAMALAGGRGDIGIITNWDAGALYSDDPTHQKGVRELNDLAANFPMQFRSGSPTKLFDDVTGANGFGLPTTRDGYPTQFYYQGNAYLNTYFVSVGDRYTFVGAGETDGWSPDGAHQPDPHYITYLLTGDYWYLEQLQFWASWGIFNPNPGDASWAAGRSPKDAVINDQVRSNAWILRTRARAGFISPDGSPEKAYFSRITEQALRMFEGRHIGSGTDPIRAFWASKYPVLQPWQTENPLRVLDVGGGYAVDPNTDVQGASAIWMFSMFCQILGHVKELGYNSNELLSWFGQLYLSMTTTPGVDGRHLSDYTIPTGKSSKSTTTVVISTGSKTFIMKQPIAPYVLGDTVTLRYDSLNSVRGPITSYNSSTGELVLNATTIQQYNSNTYSLWFLDLGAYKTWQDAFDDLTSWSSSWESNLGDLTHGYSPFALVALSYLRDQPKGDEAWNWAYNIGYKVADWPSNPKMAILPRQIEGSFDPVDIRTTSLTLYTGTVFTQSLVVNNELPALFSNTGTLPPGLIFNEIGSFFGTPTTTGSYTITVSGRNLIGTDTQAVSLVVLPKV